MTLFCSSVRGHTENGRTEAETCSRHIVKGQMIVINLLKPTGYVMHQQFNLLKPTAYMMHQQFNLLKPTGYVMNQQFNIQQLHALPTVFMCFVFI